MAKKICPTCEDEVKFDIIDGKCKACRLGVVPDWAKPRLTVATKTDPKSGLDIPACSACGQTLSRIPRGKATEAELEQTASRWAIHVLEKHPEEAGRIVREKGGHSL